MFRNTARVDEPNQQSASIDAPAQTQAAEPVPLSVLALDLADAPAGGWTVWLAERGIAVGFDDIGRPAVAREDARKLLDDQRQNEIRRQDQMVRQEAAAIEQDRAWRASLPRGIPWHQLPDPAVLPVMQMTAAAKDAQPKRRSLLEDAFAGTPSAMYIDPPTPAFEDEAS
jgi:hypothetical protein